jgi:hypothetical protein
MEMLSKPSLFTALLPAISSRLEEITLVIPGHKTRKIKRIGVVTTTVVDERDLPPGILRFIRYVSRPWGGFSEGYSFQILSTISKNAQWTDKCVHNIVKADDAEELVTVKFDWQRTLINSIAITSDNMRGYLARAERDALAYFEELAEGSRLDEKLIGATK